MNIYIKILACAIFVGATALLWLLVAGKKVTALTDREDYKIADFLEVVIKNSSDKPICFSSCYPYLIEKNEAGKWSQYEYNDCTETDMAQSCIAAQGQGKFRLALDEAESGLSRLKIPICNCAAGQTFSPDSVIYSNTFNIR